MAIEILKKGQLPFEKRYRGTCDRCGTVIQAIQSDLYYRANGYNDGAWSTRCPHEGCTHWIECEEVYDDS